MYKFISKLVSNAKQAVHKDTLKNKVSVSIQNFETRR